MQFFQYYLYFLLTAAILVTVGWIGAFLLPLVLKKSSSRNISYKTNISNSSYHSSDTSTSWFAGDGGNSDSDSSCNSGGSDGGGGCDGGGD